MSDLEKMLKNVVLGGVGAVAAVAEKSSEVAKALVEKGQATIDQNRDTAEELKRRVKQTVAPKPDPGIDLSRLTPEQRAEIRRQLDQMDAEDANPDQQNNPNG